MSLTSTLKKVEDERDELKAAIENMKAAHVEKIAELEGIVAERDGKIAEMDKDSAVKVAEFEAAQGKILDLEKQAGELAEQVKTEKAAREKAEQALADPSFLLSNGAPPVGDGGEATEPKSKSEWHAEYNAIEDPSERASFRAEHRKELGI